MPPRTPDSFFTRLTGLASHVSSWVTTENTSILHVNPYFDPTQDRVLSISIHGTADFPGAFDYLFKNLIDKLPAYIAALLSVAVTDALRFRANGIDEFANAVAEQIVAIGFEKVILTGHSRGGLIAAKLVKILQDRGITVLAVIPISAPFEGSLMATLFPLYSKSLKQMSRNSPYVQALKSEISQLSVPFFPICGGKDILVSEQSGSLGRENAVVLPEHDHISIMRTPAVVAHIQAAFTDPRVTSQLRAETSTLESLPITDDIAKQLCAAISAEITRLQTSTYLFSPIPKITILTKLKMTIAQRNSYNRNNFGDLVKAFLEDQSVTAELNLKKYSTPLDVLKENLNNSMSDSIPLSAEFVLSWVEAYHHCEIPGSWHDGYKSFRNN